MARQITLSALGRLSLPLSFLFSAHCFALMRILFLVIFHQDSGVEGRMRFT